MIGDRVRQTSNSAGTGAFALDTALPTFTSFVAAGLANGRDVFYAIVNRSRTAEWETGIGRVANGRLTRTTVVTSSAGGVRVNFGSGLKDVFCALPAANAVYLSPSGALVFGAAATPLRVGPYDVTNPAWGVKGDGSNETTAIQACIDACFAAGGGDVLFPPGSYGTTGLIMRSQIRYLFAGRVGRDGGFHSTARLVYVGSAGTVSATTGGCSKVCADYTNTQHTETIGLTADIGGVAGVAGIRVDSVGSPYSHHNTFRACRVNDGAISYQIGTSGAVGHQSDNWVFEDCISYNPSVADYRFNSQNGSQGGRITGGYLTHPVPNSTADGLDFWFSPGLLQITGVQFSGATPAGHAIHHRIPNTSGGGPNLLDGCAFEWNGGTGDIFHAPATTDVDPAHPGAPSDETAGGVWRLSGNSFSAGTLTVAGRRQFVTSANQWGTATLTSAHAGTSITSDGTDTTGTGVSPFVMSAGRLHDGVKRDGVGPWVLATIAAGATNVPMVRNGLKKWVAPAPGSIMHVVVEGDAAAAGGTLTVRAVKNGSAWFQRTLTAGLASDTGDFVAGSTPFAKGDVLEFDASTPGGWSSTAAAFGVEIYPEY